MSNRTLQHIGHDAPWIDRQASTLPTLPAAIAARLPRANAPRSMQAVEEN
jgi:hypothetical protein